jgi:hypothetical protein
MLLRGLKLIDRNPAGRNQRHRTRAFGHRSGTRGLSVIGRPARRGAVASPVRRRMLRRRLATQPLGRGFALLWRNRRPSSYRFA